jgi:hypothetical protein
VIKISSFPIPKPLTSHSYPTISSPSLPPDINRLHPTGSDYNQHAISNLQSSTTGHHLDGVEDGSGFQARILILNNTPERGSGGYVGLMNGVFAAQKRVSAGEDGFRNGFV